jgi:hypothetical protein
MNEVQSQSIGYNFNTGGLTNQKLALLGLFSKAFIDKVPIALPRMLIKDHVNKKSIPIDLGEIYNIEALLSFAQTYHLIIDDCDPADFETGGWNYFGVGASRFSHLAIHQDVDHEISKFVFDFFKSLIPRVRSLDLLQNLKQKIFVENKICVTAQFRVESDWQFHSRVTLQPTIKKPEDFCISFDRIVSKILKTLPDTKKILVFSDEAALLTPKSEMVEHCKSKMGVELVWKSDFLSLNDLSSLNNLELSIIDFELAIAGVNYVGISRSTFSNMVTFEKYARTRQLVTSDYIYNTDHDGLGLRTDNGGRIAPHQVVM